MIDYGHPYTGAAGHYHMAQQIKDFEAAVLAVIASVNATPVGTIIEYAFNDVPTNYLRMDGQTVNYDDYPILGAKYGASPGGTFVLEDMRDIPLFGASGTNAVRSITGSDTVDLTHTHPMPHTHEVDPPITTTSGPSETVAATSVLGSAASPTHTHTVNIPAFTSGASSSANTGNGSGTIDKKPRRAYAWILIKAA